MRRVFGKLATALAAAALALPGCSWPTLGPRSPDSVAELDQLRYKYANLNIENADVETPAHWDNAATPAPVSLESETREYWDLKLQECMQASMQNSKVLRDLGGQILRSPATAKTVQDPSVTETDPRFGVEAALSQFDATFNASAFVEKNDRLLNNTFFGGGTRQLKQDMSVIQAALSKQAATGTRYTLSNNTTYDANNAPGNQFPSAWTTLMDVQVRHPLLLGGGLDYNRIAGSSGIPGLYTGVLVARVNTDITLADFEMGVRNFLSDVENAYWDLYFAYRDLDSKLTARDAALETWRKISPQVQAGRLPAEQEALAREQYFRLQEEVQNALSGKLVEGTRTNNGSSGGTFRGTGGIFLAERRLRLLMGLPINDGRTIRPSEDPPKAKVVFAWDESVAEAITRRAELRRQRWLVKRRELELTAAKKFLLPTLDAVGRYRWRGFGRDLWQNDRDKTTPLVPVPNNPNVLVPAPVPYVGDAVTNLVDGNYTEWQLGAEFNMYLGARRGHTAVRNAELQLARDRTILCEQEREIVHDLSNAMSDLERAWNVLQTNYNRRVAAKEQLEALTATEGYERDSAKLFVVLESQRRLAEAENTYYRALVEYTLALKNVHFEKGSLLDYNEVYLQEGNWPGKAYEDAEEKWNHRSEPLQEKLKPLLEQPKVVTQGAYMQLVIKETPPSPIASGAAPGTAGTPAIVDGLPAEPGPESPLPITDGQTLESGEGIAPASSSSDEMPPEPTTAVPETRSESVPESAEPPAVESSDAMGEIIPVPGTDLTPVEPAGETGPREAVETSETE